MCFVKPLFAEGAFIGAHCRSAPDSMSARNEVSSATGVALDKSLKVWYNIGVLKLSACRNSSFGDEMKLKLFAAGAVVTTALWGFVLNVLFLTNSLLLVVPPTGLGIMDAYQQRNELIKVLYDTIKTCPLNG